MTKKYYLSKETATTIRFSLYYFFLNVGYVSGFFSSNAVLVSRFGPASLLHAYWQGSLFAIFFAVLFYLFFKNSGNRWLSFSLAMLGGVFWAAWFLIRYFPLSFYPFMGLRAFCYGAFVLSGLVFWLMASNSFSVFEAKRRFSQIVAFGILGDFAGGLLLERISVVLHAQNFILIWGTILLLAPLFLSLTQSRRRDFKKIQKNREEEEPTVQLKPLALNRSSINFAVMLLVFWMAYTFFSYGTDFSLNTYASKKFTNEDELTAFFGLVTALSSLVVFFYQMVIAGPLVTKFGIDRTIMVIPLLVMGSSLGVYLQPSLLTLAMAHGAIFYVAEYLGLSLINPVLNIFQKNWRGTIKVLTEGIGRPLGIFCLLGLAGLFSFELDLPLMKNILFTTSLVFLFYPFFFRYFYLKHLLVNLKSEDRSLVVNTIQALGEPNKIMAVPSLIRLLEKGEDIHLKKTIVLSLGHIQSPEALEKIVGLIRVRHETLQLAVVESLKRQNNYQSMFALYKLMKSRYSVSLQVRMNATMVLTRLVGRKMAPFLMELLYDPDIRVRANAIESIGILKDPRTIPILRPFLRDDNHRIRANAIVALYPFRSVRKEVHQTLEELYQSKKPVDLLAALYAIGILELKFYKERLLPLLENPDKKIVQQVAVALGRMGDSRFLKPFVLLLGEEKESFSLETAQKLGLIPFAGRLKVFAAIHQYDEKTKNRILAHLDKTSFDFSLEKETLIERAAIPAEARL